MTTTHNHQPNESRPRQAAVFGTVLFATGILCACLPIPTLKESPPASDADFRDGALEAIPQPSQGINTRPDATPNPLPTSTPDPFTVPEFTNIKTVSPFKPVFVLTWPDSLKTSESPALESSIYQTAKEVELREARMLLENCQIRYDRLGVGQVIGTVTMEVGTPPKATLTGDLRVTDTDKVSRVTVSAKASNMSATAYVADVRFRQVQENLSIVSIANFTRANDEQGIHLTERSARIIQRLNPGFFLLPARTGTFRIRTLLYGENDPKGGGTPLRVERSTLTITE